MATLHYWPIKARNVCAELIAAAGGIPLSRHEPDWPAWKSETHFGQLPVLTLTDTGAKVSQSLAICRVLSRRAGLEGKTEADFITSEMLLQETEDLYMATAKAMYSPGYPASRPAAFDALFAADGAARKHLTHLEAFVDASTANITSQQTAGEISVVAAIHLLEGLEPLSSLLSGLPKLTAFYAKRSAAAAATLAGLKSYWSRSGAPTEE